MMDRLEPHWSALRRRVDEDPRLRTVTRACGLLALVGALLWLHGWTNVVVTPYIYGRF